MLEHPALWLEPLRHTPDGSFRTVRDAQSMDVVGIARRFPPGPSRRHWLKPRLIEVSEAPDDSLLFAVRRSWVWSSRATVYDAEEEPIAYLRGGRVLGMDGRVTVRHDCSALAGRGSFVGETGAFWARWSADARGALIEFAHAIDEEPILRMAMLAVVLER